MKRPTLLLPGILLLLFAATPAAAGPAFPDEIPLPTGFRPEGIALGTGHTFYTGSLANGQILEGDLRTGETHELVAGQAGRLSVGMSFDDRSGFLFVAGGPNGVGRVFDTADGSLVAEFTLAGGFINDVIVTRTAAYFTNSFAAEIYSVPLGAGGALMSATADTIPLTGDWVQLGGFNANGIEATPNGKMLFVVNSASATVFTVDPTTGEATALDIGSPVPNGDGLVLLGHTLYVVQNQLNRIAVISLSPDMMSGTLGDPILSSAFAIPTTAAAFGNSLYVVNAHFGVASPATADYEIVRVDRH